MGILNSLFELGKVLLNMDEEPYHRPEILSQYVDSYGNVVQQYVYANSGHEADMHLNGTAIQGDRSIVTTHRTDIRRGIFDVHIENWDTGMPGQGMTRSENYDAGEYLRGRDAVQVDWDNDRIMQEVAWMNRDE